MNGRRGRFIFCTTENKISNKILEMINNLNYIIIYKKNTNITQYFNSK